MPSYFMYIFVDISENEVWESEEVEDFSANSCEISAPYLPSFNGTTEESVRATPLLRWLLIYLLSLQVKYAIPHSGINLLFHFLYVFFSLVGCFSPFVKIIADAFPKSKHTAEKHLGINVSFTKFVLCSKCFKRHMFNEVWHKVGSHQVTNYCNFVRYPYHPILSRRTPCHTPLLKSVELSSGRKVLYPHKIYCYESLISSFQDVLLSPGFVTDCNHWQSRISSPLVRDLYDGRVWKQFQNISGSPFLSTQFSYGLVLNIDWFQPYSHTMASVGVVYLAVMNLPRHLRYKRRNLLLIGIIPGPAEPKDINTFLEPLVTVTRFLVWYYSECSWYSR